MRPRARRTRYKPAFAYGQGGSGRPVPLREVSERMAAVERRREFVEERPGGLSVDWGGPGRPALLSGGYLIGRMTPAAVSALSRIAGRHNPQLLTANWNSLQERAEQMTRALADGSWDKDFRLRIRVDKPDVAVIGVFTDRYAHLPYDEILSPFPPHWICPRYKIDHDMAEIHVCDPDADLSGGMLYGARVLGSDAGLVRAIALSQALRLKCANGLVSEQAVEVVARMHLETTHVPDIRAHWKSNVSEFVRLAKDHIRIERDRLSLAARTPITEDAAREEMESLGIGKKRQEAAVRYAESEFGGALTRFSVGQGILYASQFESSGDRKNPSSTRVGFAADIAATRFMAGGKSVKAA